MCRDAAVGCGERRACSGGDLGVATCSLDARRGKAPFLKHFLEPFLRVATDGARRCPRLAQGAQETLLLGCVSKDIYQGTTSRKRTGLGADLTVQRPRAVQAVQIDFCPSGLKRFKRGAFSRRASREHVAVPRSPFELALRSRQPTATSRRAARSAARTGRPENPSLGVPFQGPIPMPNMPTLYAS